MQALNCRENCCKIYYAVAIVSIVAMKLKNVWLFPYD